MSQDNKNNPLQNRKGRGAGGNTSGRFESVRHEIDMSNYGWMDEDDQRTLKTQFFIDNSKSIITRNDSPDLGAGYSMNFYRGCEHGCAYCYARPTHEYLGLSAGLDFESKIFVKENAPELLREKLMSRNWEPEVLMISGVTDCYQPAERKFQITRKCLQVLNEFRNPAFIITKNHLVTRDIDILKEMAALNLIHVTISVTSLDSDLARTLEPRTSAPQARLQAIEALAKAGIPVGANIAPVIPGLTDREVPQILKAVSDAGAQSAGMVMLRLPHSVKDVFSDWLEQNKPESQNKVLGLIRDMRDGKLYESDYATRMIGKGAYAENIWNIFHVFKQKYNLTGRDTQLSIEHFTRPAPQKAPSMQRSFFDET